MRNLILLGAVGVAAACLQSTAMAQRPMERLFNHGFATKGDTWAQNHASSEPWHGQYYYTPNGQPTALVVPPTASMQQNYSWGVSQNKVTPIYHQYGAAAMPSSGGAFYATPVWPSSTRQFGVYPVRAPW